MKIAYEYENLIMMGRPVEASVQSKMFIRGFKPGLRENSKHTYTQKKPQNNQTTTNQKTKTKTELTNITSKPGQNSHKNATTEYRSI